MFILGSADNVCHIEKEVFSAQYRMVINILSGSTYSIRVISLTTLLTGATITDQTKWFVSPDCQRFAVATRVFRLNANKDGYIQISTAGQQFTAWDQQVNMAVVSGQQLWAINPDLTLKNVYNQTSNRLLPDHRIYRLGNRLLLTANNSQVAQFFAYTIDSTTNPWTFRSIYNYTFSNFSGIHSFQVSNNLTKVLVYGNTKTSQPRFDCFFINYDTRVVTNIAFPSDKVYQPLNNTFQLYENFIYIRGRNWYANNIPVQLIYYIDKDIYPIQASRVSLTQQQTTRWRRSNFWPNGSDFYFLIETEQGTQPNSQVNVMRRQVSVPQAVASSSDNKTGLIVGLSVGLTVGVVLIVLFVFCCLCKRSKDQQEEKVDPDPDGSQKVQRLDTQHTLDKKMQA